MFMFRRKRTNLTKRLLKARICSTSSDNISDETYTGGGLQRHETQGEIEDVVAVAATAAAANVNNSSASASWTSTNNIIRNISKKLEVPQLELLCAAVESKGEYLSDCVLISRGEFEDYSSTSSNTTTTTTTTTTTAAAVVVGGVAAAAVHVLCCQSWRWPDLRHADELKRLPMCGSQNDPVYMCCNPYHWSRLCEPESPPPPYSRFAMENLKPEDRAPSELSFLCRDRYVESVTTSGEGNNFNSPFPNNTGEWCRLAYWELMQRVGNQFPVREPSISVFENELRGNGLSLTTLQNGNHTPPESVRRTRAKIGHGVILSRETDGAVWAYNISTQPIFVNSPTITADMMLYSNNANANPSLCVYRVPPGHCLCIHDPFRLNANWHENVEAQMPPTGPIDPNSIRISFVKGWGPNYSRQEITACPCWLEVLLAPCR